jgi:hypothetical protein
MKIFDTAATAHVNNEHASGWRQPEGIRSPMEAALAELLASEGSALTETLEEMGMALAGRLRDHQHKNSCEHRDALRQKALVTILRQAAEQAGGLQEAFSLKNPASGTAGQILAVAIAMGQTRLSDKKSNALSRQLKALMEEKGWEAELFGMLELGRASRPLIASINRLFRQAMDEEKVPLSEWFMRLSDLPDRRPRVRALLRMLVFELSACTSMSLSARLTATLSSLRRLLLFLGLDAESSRVENLCKLPANTLLPLMMDIVSQSWLFDEWLLSRLLGWKSRGGRLNLLLQHLDVLFSMLPDPCFNDDEQREQILSVVRGLKGNQAIA